MSLFNRSKSTQSQSSTSTSSTVNNTEYTDNSQTLALQDVSGSTIVGGDMTQQYYDFSTSTDYGAINAALDAMDSATGRALLTNQNTTQTALTANVDVSGKAMNVASNALLAMLSAVDSSTGSVERVTSKALDTVNSNSQGLFDTVGNLFDDALSFAGNAMSTAAHAARSESAQIMSEITDSQTTMFKYAAIALAAVGGLYAISRIWAK